MHHRITMIWKKDNTNPSKLGTSRTVSFRCKENIVQSALFRQLTAVMPVGNSNELRDLSMDPSFMSGTPDSRMLNTMMRWPSTFMGRIMTHT